MTCLQVVGQTGVAEVRGSGTEQVGRRCRALSNFAGRLTLHEGQDQPAKKTILTLLLTVEQ